MFKQTLRMLIIAGLILTIAGIVVALAGCSGSPSAAVVSPVLIVESSTVNLIWTYETNMNGFVSVPSGSWQRVRADSGETVSARIQGPQDGWAYIPNSEHMFGGVWRYDFVVTKGGQTFDLTVLVDGN